MEQTIKYQEVHTNRNHKSTLFVRLFEDKKDLLSLYNALNHTNYQNEDDLEVNTIEGNLYMNVKNDVSILLDSTMNLYEHQSTYNPNMPLRGLLHFAQLYNKYVKSRRVNIYSSALQKIPLPQYVVFYNGTKKQPDEQILRLSDAFQKSDEDTQGCLECEVRMLNINYGHNKELMERCKRLKEYAIFVDKVRKYTQMFPSRVDMAISKAIDECIAEGILKSFLEERKSEVLELVLNEFDKELYEKEMKQDAYAEGLAQGLTQGHRECLLYQVRAKLAKNKSTAQIAEELEEQVSIIEELVFELRDEIDAQK